MSLSGLVSLIRRLSSAVSLMKTAKSDTTDGRRTIEQTCMPAARSFSSKTSTLHHKYCPNLRGHKKANLFRSSLKMSCNRHFLTVAVPPPSFSCFSFFRSRDHEIRIARCRGLTGRKEGRKVGSGSGSGEREEDESDGETERETPKMSPDRDLWRS